MVLPRLLHLLLPLASVTLAKPLHKPFNTRSTDIEWGPCDFESAGTLPIECAGLPVPLDYTAPNSSQTLTLELIRSRAIKTPSKGSILFNFGGPGYESIHSLDLLAAVLHNKTGAQHDLIGFNTRGLGNTLRFSCFDTPKDRQLANYRYPILPLEASDVALVNNWANSQAIANICQTQHSNTDMGELIGTTFVARDMMQIVDALNEDGLLRFWGFSYGSLLGETVAAMFPDRMDKLILDGVVNAFNYYNRLGVDVDQLLSADSAFRATLSECLKAGPSKCALAADSPSGSIDTSALESRVEALAQTLKSSPIVVNTTIFSYQTVKDLIFVTIKYPSDVPTSLLHLHNLLNGQNLSAIVEFYRSLEASIAMGNDDSLLGIKCGDTHPRASSLAELMPDIERMKETSDVFGTYIAGVVAQCGPWPFKSREMFDTGILSRAVGERRNDTGGSGIRTKHPILFLGNTFDPATPVASARNMSTYFSGSVVVEQKGFGHCSLSQVSDCTNSITRSYLLDGTLPEDGTACEVDTSLF